MVSNASKGIRSLFCYPYTLNHLPKFFSCFPLTAALAASNSVLVACPSAYSSATSIAAILRGSVIRCCTCLAHHTAYSRHTLACSGADLVHQRASSNPKMSRIVIKAIGSSSALVFPRDFMSIFHLFSHGWQSLILFNVVEIIFPPLLKWHSSLIISHRLGTVSLPQNIHFIGYNFNQIGR